MKNKCLAAVLALLLTLTLTACGSKQQPPSEPDSPSEPPPTAEEPQPEAPQNNLFTVVLETDPDQLTGFLYCANEPYTQVANGGLIPSMGVSAALFTCSKNQSGPYTAQEDAFVDQLAAALSTLTVNPDSKTVTHEDYPIPDTDDYIGFWLTLGEWEPFLYLFPTGDIYVEMNRSDDHSAYHFQLENPADYRRLADALAEISDAIDSMPLDYNFRLSIWLDEFLPQSQAVKLSLYNDSGRAIQFSPAFTVEREEGGAWQTLTEIDPQMHTQAMREVPPRDSIRFGIDLTNLQGGQEPGRYRVTNTFHYADGDGMPFTAEYEISATAAEISYPLPPEMTAENEDYCARYISTWGFYNPFREDFAEGGYPSNFHTYHLYYMLSGLEGERDEAYMYGDIPAERVEGVISRHFTVTPEQIRALSRTPAQSPSEHYDPDRAVYHFEGGYGGGSMNGVVTDSSRDGDLLTLTCRWYGMDDAFIFEHVVTVQTGPDDNDFVYTKNRVTIAEGDIPNYAGS